MRDAFLDGDVLSNRIEVWRDRLLAMRDDRFVAVAEDGSRLVGFICVFGDEDPRRGSLIDNLHVAHEHKRRGIGASLMRHAGRWLTAHDPGSGVYLWVMEANREARRFYERLGAADAGIVERQNPGGGSAPNCRYVWPGPGALLDGCAETSERGAS